MSWWKTLGVALGQLITLIVAIAVIGTADTQFEKVVVCGLLLIYLATTNMLRIVGRVTVEQDRKQQSRFVQLKTLIGHEPSETDLEELRSYDQLLSGTNRAFLVRTIGTSVTSIVAVLALWSAL